MVTACFGDLPPAAEDLPLEIVVHPDECILNYPQVGPGTHEVTVIYEGTRGSVSILAGEQVVYSNEGGSGNGRVELEVGSYVVACQTEDRHLEVDLTVREGLPPGGN